MKRVVCYCRVSTEEEKQLNALQKQIEELEQFVNNKIDWELIDTYVDEGKSGTSTKGRPSYQKLFDYIFILIIVFTHLTISLLPVLKL